MPVANARMYSATPELRSDWKTLLTWVLARARLDWPVIDYDPPAPLNALWARDDLGLAMICGQPFARRVPRPRLIAAPVPSPAHYGNRPVYFTDFVVRADSPAARLEDTFGGIVGYTLEDSLSGGVAPRVHLAGLRERRGNDDGRLYSGAVGNLIHARGVIEALVRGDIVVGPVDSYYHDLLRHNDPAFASQVRTIASTEPRPIPPLVATADIGDGAVAAIRTALTAALSEPGLAAPVARLLLAGFAWPTDDDYAPLADLAGSKAPPFEQL